LIGVLDRRLNRENRSETDRTARGVLVVLIVCGLSAAVGWVVAWLTRHHDFGWIVELALTFALLAQRSLYNHVRAVARALNGGGIDAGRAAVAHIVGRDVRQLDGHGVARAAIESCAENFSDGVVAPVFWYLLFGFPGLLVYKAVNTMDSMIGYTTPRYRAFGMAAARLDDALNLIPARLAGVFLAAAAVSSPTANPFRALKVMVRDGGKHRSPNAGWPEGAMAGALGLALAGPRRYAESVVDGSWIGDGRARATQTDINRALYLYGVACLVNGLMVAVLAAIRLGLA
jgi:adenosylcobinamide-phosphate synthase